MPPSLVRARGGRERRAFRRRARVVVASLARACVVACVIASRTAEAGLSDWSNARVGARSSRARLDDGTTVGASGGTELMARALEKRVPRVLVDRFHIIKSRVRDASADAETPNVLWLHDLPNDPENAHLRDAASRARFAKFIFVSEWQRSAYAQYFGDVFGDKATVLRNAVEPFPRQRREPPRDGVMRLIYHTTPHRGLDVLMGAFAKIYERYEGKVHLDVYSSFAVYGWKQRDAPFEHLFETCRRHAGCTYHGAVSNEEVREALTRAHVFAYPSTWMETSCIAAIEALSAGVHVVSSNLGALPETLRGFGTTYPYEHDKEMHADTFERALVGAIDSYWQPEKIRLRRIQQVYASQIFGWGSPGQMGRADEWVQILGSMHDDFNGVRTIKRDAFESDADYSNALFVAARVQHARGDEKRAFELYTKAIEVNPLNAHVLPALGTLESEIGEKLGDRRMLVRGIERLEYVIRNPEKLTPPLSVDSASYYGAAMRSGFFRESRHFTTLAKENFKLGFNSSRAGSDDCWDLYDATSVPHFPMNSTEERKIMANFNARVDELMRLDDIFCPRINAMSSVFSIAYYWDGVDYRQEYSKWVQLKMKVFPELAYASPMLKYEQSGDYLSSAQSRARQKSIAKRKVKVGVISSFFKPDSSIWGNFGHMVRGLQKDSRLDVSMVYFPRVPVSEEDKTLSLTPDSSIYLQQSHGVDSVSANRNLIESRKFDVLLYLDLFMTSEMHDLAVAKLAPVQIVTHGHPVTSGIPREIMDYFLTWDLAEDPDKARAQEFYTEELLMVKSKGRAWEYFEPRTKDEVSLITGSVSFSHFTRETLDFIPRHEMTKFENSTWYFCPQAVFKYHVTFDKILGKIQAEDPNAVIILMQLVDPTLEALHVKVVERLQKQGGVDLDRVVFVPRMKHNELMAMNKLTDVVLDSVFFGGDTTTREAFEVGAPVVTLPGKTIGQRWTQAYYAVMGISDFIAKSADEYVKIAVREANASSKQKEKTRTRIKAAVHNKLFRESNAPKLWADSIIDVARRPTRWRWLESNSRDGAAKDEL